MGRQKQPEIRERLLDACTDHAVATGLPDRLGSFADATGVSPRMLLYHFDTKQQLQRQVLQRARARQRRLYGDLMRPREDESYLETLARMWITMTGLPARRYIDLFGRLREDTEQRLWPDFRVEATVDWLGPLEDGMASLGRPELATTVLAVIRGLIMDLEATEDRERVDAAFASFLTLLRGDPQRAMADESIVPSIYAAYNAQDGEALLALVSERVDWQDGDRRIAGKAALRSYHREQWRRTRTHDEVIGFRQPTPGEFVVHVDQVVRTVGGETVSRGRFEHRLRVADGKVVRFDIVGAASAAA